MTDGAEFRQYADEARLWASQSTTQEERRALISLAATWTLAAAVWEQQVLKFGQALAH
jgi:hypothetical protein